MGQNEGAIDVNVNGSEPAKAIDVPAIKSSVERILRIARIVVKLTPNQTDDKVVETVAALAENQWAWDLLAEVIHLFSREKNPAALAEILRTAIAARV
jgi:hypothetical protein